MQSTPDRMDSEKSEKTLNPKIQEPLSFGRDSKESALNRGPLNRESTAIDDSSTKVKGHTHSALGDLWHTGHVL